MTEKRTLSDVLDEKARELVSEWAYRNRAKVWLGHASREQIIEEMVALQRQAYDMAKRRYGGNDDAAAKRPQHARSSGRRDS